jgi:hypothetical protein
LKNREFAIFSTSRESLATIKPSQSSSPVSFFYDRNLHMTCRHDFEFDHHHVRFDVISSELNRDCLLIPTFDDGVTVFDSEQGRETGVLNSNLAVMTVCIVDGEWRYAGGTDKGELVIFDYGNYRELNRYSIANHRVTDLCYHKSECIFVVFLTEVRRFDLKSRTVLERFSIGAHEVCGLHGDLFLVGAKSGLIQSFLINSQQVLEVSDPSMVFHKDIITGLSFSRTFCATSSRDQFVKFWDYQLNLIGEIWFPFPILTCELLNGKRHLLIATEKAILVVNGPTLFGDTVDTYEGAIDSFDLLQDSKSIHADKEKEPEEDEPIVTELPPEEIPQPIVAEPSFVPPEMPSRKASKAKAPAPRKAVAEAVRQKLIEEMLAITNAAGEADEKRERASMRRESNADTLYITAQTESAVAAKLRPDDFAPPKLVPQLTIPHAPPPAGPKKKRSSRRGNRSKVSARKAVPEPVEPKPKEKPVVVVAVPTPRRVTMRPMAMTPAPAPRPGFVFGPPEVPPAPPVVPHTFAFNLDTIFGGIPDPKPEPSASPRYGAPASPHTKSMPLVTVAGQGRGKGKR